MYRRNTLLTIAGVAAFIVIGIGVKTTQSTTRALEVQQVTSDFKKGAVLVDVRSRADYAQEHAVGSINIPLNEITDDLSLSMPNSTRIYLHGYDESSLRQANNDFTKKGFQRVIELGTIHEWKEIGGSTIK